MWDSTARIALPALALDPLTSFNWRSQSFSHWCSESTHCHRLHWTSSRNTSKNRYILTFVDCFTRWPEAIAARIAQLKPSPNISSTFTSAGTTLHERFSLIMDRLYSRFTKNKQLIEKAGTKQLFTPTYHPESNPAERLNQTIGTALRALIGQHKTDWTLPSFRASWHSSGCERTKTGYSPIFPSLWT